MEKKSTTGLLTCKKQAVSLSSTEILKTVFSILFIFLSFISLKSFAQPDLMVRDCFADELANGQQPSVCTTPIYTSDGIKVLQDPLPNYSPYPFSTGTVDAVWSAIGDMDAEYRDATKYSKPNWIYVKISNKGTTASSGDEVLKIYWAKGSTGLTWPNMWGGNGNAYFNTHPGCTGSMYLGDEVTKPRRNWASLSQSERALVVLAIQQLDAAPFYQDNVSKWDKQDQIHQSTHIHMGPTFLPWHREFINRFENLLRGVFPDIKLPYWNWVNDPSVAPDDIIGYNDPFHFGAAGSPGLPQRAGAPFGTFDNNYTCDPTTRGSTCASCFFPIFCYNCTEQYVPALPPQVIERELNYFTLTDDQTIVTSGDANMTNMQYMDFRMAVEGNHNNAHVIIGGNLGCQHTSFQDPFVFLLHSNVDKIFSMWQRHKEIIPTNNYHLYRLDNSTTNSGVYGDEGLNPIQPCPDDVMANDPAELINPFEPWANHPNAAVNAACLTPMRPWMSPDNEDIVKNAFDPSVVNPPIYDEALLTIPILEAGESVIMQMPWYPPDPGPYSCFSDQNHFCLLARIETEPNYPYGMYVAETGNVGDNTYWNNNIAWKNIQLYNIHAGSQLVACVLVRNMQTEKTKIKLSINTPAEEKDHLSYFANGTVILHLPDKLYDLWITGGRAGKQFEDLGHGKIKLKNEQAWIGNIELQEANEEYEVCLKFKVNNVPPDQGAFHINLEQTDDQQFKGGEQFKLSYGNENRNSKPAVSVNSKHQEEYAVSPNPMQSAFLISANNGTTENSAYLYDIMGQVIYKEKFGNKTNIDVSNLPDGIYMLKIVNAGNNHEFFQKIVKN